MLFSTINFASIMGIREDTHLKGQQYAWLTTCGKLLSVGLIELATNVNTY
jgi:hypothetical protein